MVNEEEKEKEASETDISFLINNPSSHESASDFPFVDPAIVNTTDFPEQEEIEGVSLVMKKYIYVGRAARCSLEPCGASLHSRSHVRVLAATAVLRLRGGGRGAVLPGARAARGVRGVCGLGERGVPGVGPSGPVARPAARHFRTPSGAPPA